MNISHALAYHMSYTASAITIGAILVPVYAWCKFARTPRWPGYTRRAQRYETRTRSPKGRR